MRSVVFALSLSLLASCTLAADINELAWLSGCWKSIGDDPGSGEQWTRPAGGTMLGVSRTVAGDKTVAFEFVRIITEDDGELTYIASPSGQATARFALVSLTTEEVVFANPDHDFPQRIIYRLTHDGNLTGRIEGTSNGVARGVDFPLARQSCDPEGAANR